MPRRDAAPRYALHPGYRHEAAGIANLEQRTGRSLEQWLALLTRGPRTPAARIDWLSTSYGLTRTTARWLVDRAEGRGGAEAYDPEAIVAQLYAGKKAALRPLHDRLMAIGMALGRDVTATPCKTFVPLRRRHVFAQIKPSTQTRIDLGLALGDTVTPKRLLDTGGRAKGDRITHRIPISAAGDIDATVERWLERAYRLDS